MYLSLLPLVVAVSTVLAAPQGRLEGLSPCITTALLSAFGSTDNSCSLTDTQCLCAMPGFQDALEAAITANCGSDEAASAESAGAALCADAGERFPVGSDSSSDSETTSSETNSSDSPSSSAPDATAALTAAPSEAGTGGDSMVTGENATTGGNGTTPMSSPPVHQSCDKARSPISLDA